MPPWLVQKTKGGLKSRLFYCLITGPCVLCVFAVQLKKLINRPPQLNKSKIGFNGVKCSRR